MSKVRAALRKALRDMPGSIRQLAEEAGLTHPSLIYVRDGRQRLRPENLRAVIRVLRRWARTCARLADELEAAAQEEASKEEDDGEA
jgi:hypothetical protein